ncbi:MAG: redoxin domain-containing protein [Bacteroidetes bacterium]|nr:MAG: redoxin domain-containing protein [Bacteroidota bacterium]
MKYRHWITTVLALLFCHVILTGQTTPAATVQIRLQVDGLSTTSRVYLQAIHENKKSTLDSTYQNGQGEIVFQYRTALEPGYYNVLLPSETELPVLLSDDQTVTLCTQMDQPIENMAVEGSLENELLYNSLQYDGRLGERFQAEIQEIQRARQEALDQAFINQLRTRYFLERESYYATIFSKYTNSLYVKYEKARQEPAILDRILSASLLSNSDRQRMLLSHYWDNVDFSDARLLHTPVVYDKLWQYFNKFVPDQTDLKLEAVDILMDKVADHPAYYRFFATWLAEEYRAPFTGNMDPDALYIHMVDHYLTYERAFWADSLQVYAWNLRSEDQRASLVGMAGQTFTAKDIAGTEHNLFDLQSPYIALFFYHADCDHCIETTPKLVQKYQELKDQGLEVVAISMSTPEDEWKAFMEQNRMDGFVNLTDEDSNSIYKRYFVRATPEIYLLNPDRKIIGKHLSVEDIQPVMQLDKTGGQTGSSPTR